jgi:hypothetical protein
VHRELRHRVLRVPYASIVSLGLARAGDDTDAHVLAIRLRNSHAPGATAASSGATLASGNGVAHGAGGGADAGGDGDGEGSSDPGAIIEWGRGLGVRELQWACELARDFLLTRVVSARPGAAADDAEASADGRGGASLRAPHAPHEASGPSASSKRRSPIPPDLEAWLRDDARAGGCALPPPEPNEPMRGTAPGLAAWRGLHFGF